MKMEAELRQIDKELADAKLAKLMLSQTFMYRLRQKNGSPPTWADSLVKAKAEKYLDQPMIRPVDMLLEGLKQNGSYEILGFYPGRWRQCDGVLAGSRKPKRANH